VNAADARLWHPWLRINRVLRAMLHTRWSAEAGGETNRIMCDGVHRGRWPATVKRETAVSDV
jgi:hypothetical protein